jgi:Fur family ferric uptake transcriptional regulator
MHSTSLNNWQSILQTAGLKVTPRRIAVLSALAQADAPLDVEKVKKQVNTQMDTVTVYRIIEALLHAGLVKRIDFQEGKFRYELNQHHHHHLVCRSCEKVIPFAESQCLGISDAEIKKKFGFQVNDHSLEIFGKCHRCSSKGAV